MCSSQRQSELKRLCYKNSIEIFDALETKTTIDKFNDAVEKMGEEWTIMGNQVPETRDSIWLGWKTMKWKGSILRAYEQFIHMRMENVGGYLLDLTVVYGENSVIKRRRLWEGISDCRIISNSNDWIMIGDFNEIRHPAERDGHGSFDRAGAEDFENAIIGFTELEAVGGNFTWSNGPSPQHTRSRLDRR